MRWIHFYLIFLSHDFTDLLQNSLPLSTHIFFEFLLDCFKTFWEALVIVIPFLFFKKITFAYLVKISITRNRKRIHFLNLINNYISVRSVPQLLSIKGDFTFLLLDFLIVGLCHSSSNLWSDILSFLIPPSEVF